MNPPIDLSLQNGIPHATRFSYEGLPMSFCKNRTEEVKKLAVRFAPLLRIFDADFEVDWEFYAQAGKEYQDSMHIILLALGVLTLRRGGNFYLAPLNKTSSSEYMPSAKPWSHLHFHVLRRADAEAYLQHASDILKRRGLTIPQSGLQIVQSNKILAPLQDSMVRKNFNPNELQFPVVVTGTREMPVLT